MRAASTRQAALTAMAGKSKNITLYFTKLRNVQVSKKIINFRTVNPAPNMKMNRANVPEEQNALFTTVIKIGGRQSKNFRF
jgi:hypothetical protein